MNTSCDSTQDSVTENDNSGLNESRLEGEHDNNEELKHDNEPEKPKTLDSLPNGDYDPNVRKTVDKSDKEAVTKTDVSNGVDLLLDKMNENSQLTHKSMTTIRTELSDSQTETGSTEKGTANGEHDSPASDGTCDGLNGDVKGEVKSEIKTESEELDNTPEEGLITEPTDTDSFSLICESVDQLKELTESFEGGRGRESEL